MNHQLVKKKTPEEIELEKKLAELATLEGELAQLELDLATLEAELRAFNLRYLRIVGVKLAKLDEINANIAEILALLNPQDTQAAENARKTRSQASESAQEVGTAQEEPESHTKFAPSEDIKSLYREVAKLLHPDLVTDEEERGRRTKWMAEANAAYQAGDEVRLWAIYNEWSISPDSVRGDDIGAELIRAVRKIAQVQFRIQFIKSKIIEMKDKDTYLLKTKVEISEAKGQNILEEMAMQLDKQIAEKEKLLGRLIIEKHGRA